jgi:hypothetical protein
MENIGYKTLENGELYDKDENFYGMKEFGLEVIKKNIYRGKDSNYENIKDQYWEFLGTEGKLSTKIDELFYPEEHKETLRYAQLSSKQKDAEKTLNDDSLFESLKGVNLIKYLDKIESIKKSDLKEKHRERSKRAHLVPTVKQITKKQHSNENHKTDQKLRHLEKMLGDNYCGPVLTKKKEYTYSYKDEIESLKGDITKLKQEITGINKILESIVKTCHKK